MADCTCHLGGRHMLTLSTRTAEGCVVTKTWIIPCCAAASLADHLGTLGVESVTTAGAAAAASAAATALGRTVDIYGAHLAGRHD